VEPETADFAFISPHNATNDHPGLAGRQHWQQPERNGLRSDEPGRYSAEAVVARGTTTTGSRARRISRDETPPSRTLRAGP
jgi:hypothetical protein